MFLLAALAVLTTSILGGELSYAKASAHLAIAHTAQSALSLGEAQLLSALQETVLQNLNAGRPSGSGIDGTYSRSFAGPIVGSNVSYVSYAQINGATSQSGSDDTAQNLQASSLGQEQRFSAVVSVELHGSPPGNVLLAKRSRLLTLRIFSVIPYAIADSARDVATMEDAGGAAEGDPAGTLAEAGDVATPDPNRPDLYHDTAIKVRHQCAGPDTGAVDPGTFGYQWGVSGADAIDSACVPTPPPWAPSPPPPPPAGIGDTFTAKQWGNSNLNQSGWTR
jgi:hypothetical protein